MEISYDGLPFWSYLMPVSLSTRIILLLGLSNYVARSAASPACSLPVKTARNAKQKMQFKQSVLKIVRSFLVLLFLIVAPLGASQAGVPSYIGPYYYAGATSSGGTIVVNGLSSEEAVIPALVAQFISKNPLACNVRSAPPQNDWNVGYYDANPIEGVEVSASRSFIIRYNSSCSDSIDRQVTRYLLRRRLVCSSTHRYLDNKCVSGAPVTLYSGKGANLGPSCPSCGQPINPSTGNMWHVERDYSAAASPLIVERTYNSYQYTPVALRPFGVGWSHPYSAVLKQGPSSPDFQGQSCWRRSDTLEILCSSPIYPTVALPESVTITRGDGKHYVFNRSGEQWIGAADTNDRLTPVFNTDRTAVLEWIYQSARTDSSERYGANGLLLSITSRTGGTQHLTYSTGASNDTGASRYPIESPVCSKVHDGLTVPANTLLCVTDHAGRQLNFSYDASGRIIKLHDPADQAIQYEYDGVSGGCLESDPSSRACSANNLTKVTYPDGTSRTYIYNERNQISAGAACTNKPALSAELGHLLNAMTGLVDENGNRHISWTYACEGSATSSELAGGVEKVTLSYSRLSTGVTGTTVTHTVGDPANPQTTARTFNATPVLGVMKNSSVSGICAECGSIASRTYDANGNTARATDFNGAITTYVYDLSRNLETSRTEASGTTAARTITTAWHPQYRVPTQVAEPKRMTTYTHDSQGNVLTRTEQATEDLSGATGLSAIIVGRPRTWTYTYNSIGKLTSIRGPRTDVQDVTTYVYDAAGNLSSITNPAGHVTTLLNYDPHGRVGQIVSPDGAVTTLGYTARGWLATRTVTDGAITETTSFDYTGSGQVKKITQPDGTWTSYTYDGAHRLMQIADQAGNSVTYTLDLTGNRVREQVADASGALRRQIARVFDTNNRMKQQIGSAQ